MSQYYKIPRGADWNFDPNGKNKFSLSRSKLELFHECPRCFYLDNRLGLKRPSGFPFSLNSAVDALLKKEFDIHRAEQTAHPLMKTYGIDAVPFQHEKMEEWRDALRHGIKVEHKPTGLLVRGAIDDIWVSASRRTDEELMVVDYKATSKEGEVSLDAEWQEGYKRQMEIYQWLLRQNGFKVSDTGYFVYCNGDTDKEAFDGKLEFDIKVIPYTGSDDWVEDAIISAHKCLMGDEIPKANDDCDYCRYREAVGEVL